MTLVAMSLYRKKMSPSEIDISNMANKDVLELIDKIHCISDDEYKNSGHFPGWVKITMNDGVVYEADQRFEQGAPENPIQRDTIITKYRNNAAINLSVDAVGQLEQYILALETEPSINRVLNSLIMD